MHYSTFGVGVYGVTGYAGSELMKIISAHPNLSLSFAQSSSASGAKVSDIFQFIARGGEVNISREPDPGDADIAFICLPPGESMRLVPGLIKKDVRVVDLGPDYRLKPASLFETVYGLSHSDPENLETSSYGVPELNKGQISEATLVSNPGCYPTAALLALYPVADLLTGNVIIDAKSGTSGSGKEPTQFNNHSEIGQNIRPYNPDRHRHKHEIVSFLSSFGVDGGNITFVPHLVPIVRGIEESIYLPGVDPVETADRLRSFYSKSRFVHVVGEGSLNMVQGTNHCLLQVEATGNGTVVFSYIDNLMKGASGQAVQNANVMMGLPEETGLIFGGTGIGR